MSFYCPLFDTPLLSLQTAAEFTTVIETLAAASITYKPALNGREKQSLA